MLQPYQKAIVSKFKRKGNVTYLLPDRIGKSFGHLALERLAKDLNASTTAPFTIKMLGGQVDSNPARTHKR